MVATAVRNLCVIGMGTHPHTFDGGISPGLLQRKSTSKLLWVRLDHKWESHSKMRRWSCGPTLF
jgi:hypothetical protein